MAEGHRACGADGPGRGSPRPRGRTGPARVRDQLPLLRREFRVPDASRPEGHRQSPPGDRDAPELAPDREELAARAVAAPCFVILSRPSASLRAGSTAGAGGWAGAVHDGENLLG